MNFNLVLCVTQLVRISACADCCEGGSVTGGVAAWDSRDVRGLMDAAAVIRRLLCALVAAAASAAATPNDNAGKSRVAQRSR